MTKTLQILSKSELICRPPAHSLSFRPILTAHTREEFHPSSEINLPRILLAPYETKLRPIRLLPVSVGAVIDDANVARLHLTFAEQRGQ
jgi:hypothetical protein